MRHRVDREEAAGRAVLRRHVGDRRAVGETEVGQSRTEELDELADHPLLAQHLGHGEHEVGRRRPFRQTSGQAEADHLRNEHRHRLAEHRGLRFDTADPPTQDTQTVDHRGVRIGADEGVGIGPAVLLHHHPRQVLEVHLVDDAGRRRHDAKVAERLLAPAQEEVALVVALELLAAVEQQRRLAAVLVDLHRMVDDQLDRLQRVDPVGVAAHRHHRVAHRGEVDHRGHAGEVLQQDASRHEGDLARRCGRRVPPAEEIDLLGGDDSAVLAAKEILEQDLERIGEARKVVAALLERGQAGDLEALPADREGTVTGETVLHGVGSLPEAADTQTISYARE